VFPFANGSTELLDTQVIFSGLSDVMLDMDDLREILAHNLAALMARSADMKTQSALARRSKVSQKTISNYLVAASYTGAPSLGKVEKLARVFGLETWQLIHPTMGDRTITATELAMYQKLRDAIKAAESD
jgi:hypothetical protein